MSRYAVERAALCRLALALEGEAAAADVWRLSSWLEPAVEVGYGQVILPMMMTRSDGGAAITLPAGLDERREAAFLLEEIAHWLCRSGLRPPSPVWAGQASRWNLDERREAAEEDEAALFSAMFVLGGAADLEPDGEPFVERSELHRRLPRLAALREDLFSGCCRRREPPRWSAARDFRVEVRRCRLHSRLRAIPRAGGAGGYIELLPDEARLAGAAGELAGSLLALREEELRLKYAPAWVGAPEPVEWDWSEELAPLARLMDGRLASA